VKIIPTFRAESAGMMVTKAYERSMSWSGRRSEAGQKPSERERSGERTSRKTIERERSEKRGQLSAQNPLKLKFKTSHYCQCSHHVFHQLQNSYTQLATHQSPFSNVQVQHKLQLAYTNTIAEQSLS